MSRFYFDTSDGSERVVDREGVWCSNRAAARREAAAALADMAKDELPDGQLRRFSVQVRDEYGLWFEAELTYRGRETRPDVNDRPIQIEH